MIPFEEVVFDDLLVRSLPGDASRLAGVREVRGACYSLVDPTPVREPRLLAWSREAGELLGVERPVDGQVLGGNRLLAGMKPYAACYGGHQFGNWAGQLGDGRAINLGETVNRRGEHWTLQLKGAGPTP